MEGIRGQCQDGWRRCDLGSFPTIPTLITTKLFRSQLLSLRNSHLPLRACFISCQFPGSNASIPWLSEAAEMGVFGPDCVSYIGGVQIGVSLFAGAGQSCVRTTLRFDELDKLNDGMRRNRRFIHGI